MTLTLLSLGLALGLGVLSSTLSLLGLVANFAASAVGIRRGTFNGVCILGVRGGECSVNGLRGLGVSVCRDNIASGKVWGNSMMVNYRQ